MKQMKLKDLKKDVDRMVKDGHGEKYLVVPCDNEGNFYHGIYYTVSQMDDDMGEFVLDSMETDCKNILIIG